MLKEFLAGFGITKELFDETKLVKIGNNYFLVQKELQDFLKFKPAYAGEKLFWTRGEKIVPSLKLLESIGLEAKKAVTLNFEGEWLFICGRDIMAKSIIESTGSPKANDLVVVKNRFGECIGYGLYTGAVKGVVVKRLFDVGDFLRRERKTRKLKSKLKPAQH